MSPPLLFLTGATGFVGAHLAKLFIESGFRLSALYRGVVPTECLRIPFANDVEWIGVDFAEEWIKDHNPTAVVHLATDYGRGGILSACVDTNISLPLRLLEAANAGGTSLFLNADSFFGKTGFNYPHMKPYTLSKAQFLAWGRHYASVNNIRFLTMRLEHVNGEFDNESKFVTNLKRRMLVPNEIIELTSGEQRRDFIHVTDVARAFLAVIHKYKYIDNNVDMLEVGTGDSITVKSFVEKTHHLASSTAILKFGALPQRNGEIFDSKARNGPLQELGWRPATDLQQGIARTLRSLVNEAIR